MVKDHRPIFTIPRRFPGFASPRTPCDERSVRTRPSTGRGRVGRKAAGAREFTSAGGASRAEQARDVDQFLGLVGRLRAATVVPTTDGDLLRLGSSASATTKIASCVVRTGPRGSCRTGIRLRSPPTCPLRGRRLRLGVDRTTSPRSFWSCRGRVGSGCFLDVPCRFRRRPGRVRTSPARPRRPGRISSARPASTSATECHEVRTESGSTKTPIRRSSDPAIFGRNLDLPYWEPERPSRPYRSDWRDGGGACSPFAAGRLGRRGRVRRGAAVRSDHPPAVRFEATVRRARRIQSG